MISLFEFVVFKQANSTGFICVTSKHQGRNKMKENSTVVSEALKRGFTLIEILIAVSIVAILATGAAISIPKMLEDSKIKAAKTSVMALRDAVIAYNLSYGKYPSNLEALADDSGDKDPIIESEDMLVDPFGNDYKMEGKGSRIVIVSAGPDGEFGTSDDISSKSKKKSQ